LCSASPIVLALRAPGGLAGLLDGGKQKRDQDRDNRDDDQQFNQGERAAFVLGKWTEHARIPRTIAAANQWHTKGPGLPRHRFR